MTVHGSWTVDRPIEAYTHHQRRTRGLRPQTLLPIDPSRLTPAAVVVFITSLPHRFSPASMQTARSSSRSFFWFLRVEGFCGDALEAALPTVAHWRLATLPRSLTGNSSSKYSRRSTSPPPCGHRDQPIVQCLATLGLRPGEVADLCLDDIDWRGGSLTTTTVYTKLDLPRLREVALPSTSGLRRTVCARRC